MYKRQALSFGSYIQISSDELEEGKLAGKEITVNLKDGKFETDLNQANWVVEGLPAGITYSLKRINDTKAVIILKGNEVVDYDSNLTVTVKVDAGEIGDTGYSSVSYTHLDVYKRQVIDSGGIPLLYGIDAVHGNNNLYGATIYPHNIGLAAANNTQLVEQIGEATASEVRAMGANWTFTPTLGVDVYKRQLYSL